MRDKRTVLFPSLLFVVLFILITVTGFLQIKIIQKNLQELLKSQGEILFKHLKREIDINLEYLSLLDKSPSIITPNFLNIMVYDEAIVEDLYNLLSDTRNLELGKIPLEDLLILDDKGKVLARKGTLKIPASYIRPLVSKKQETFVKMPSKQENSLVMGLRIGDRIVFFSLDDAELEAFRKKSIVKEILDSEGKRFDISGINIYGPKGEPYLTTGEKRGNVYVLSRLLDSKFLPKYRMEILLSRVVADDIFRRMTVNFVFVLVFLLFSGALSTYAIFLMNRKHDEKVKEMEREIELKDRLVSLGRLASGMAHEIRNPLNAISISVQRLKREFVPEEGKRDEYNAFIDIVRGELRRVDRIVEEFLLSTKSRVPFARENLYAIADDVVTLIREKALLKGIDIVNHIDRDAHVECQKERLKQAFYNIVLNGIEAIGNNGVVEISSVMTRESIDISVKDTGPGIKEGDLRTIFEYYFTTKDKGMGLGLPISYMIVKDHGGDIKVLSEKGKGTKFVISLPLNQTKNARSAVPDVP
ncbi:MAG: Sensor protein ZraS [Syntrophorhabdus sp. PtaB.Bin006]|nr:MAG: Sensor protein ZraS [Syntrophorhabdus sp. PtaB.Bin006]